MKILGIGTPEILMMFCSLVVISIIVAVIVLVVAKTSKKPNSAAAYQRIAQLDDLRKRGAITEDEYQQHKNEAAKDL